ncbi:MAG: DUF2179 domain-containing protein [Campylobacteraceae bacterium]
MEFSELFSSEAFKLYGIPLLICLARITDVTIGTVRIIFVSKGMKNIAPILGFVEICIWLTAITQVMENLTNPINFFAYALGYSLGNYLGIYIEGKIALGAVVIRIITKRDSHSLITKLREKGSVTVIDAEGNNGPVNVIFMVIKRAEINQVLPIILHFNPNAVYSIQDVRHASDEWGGGTKDIKKRNWLEFIVRGIRK